VTCQEALELMPALLDQALPVLDMVRLERHVAECRACREAQASETWLAALLAAGALSDEPPASLRRQIMECIAAEAAAAARIEARRRRRVLLPALAGIAVFALVAAVVLSFQRNPRRPSEPPAFRDVVSEHRAYVAVSAPRLEITAPDAARLAQWIKARLGLTVALPPSGARGEAPVGARVATVDGRPAAHVVYAGGGGRISLFVAGRPPRRLPEEGEHIIDGVEVYTTTLEANTLGWWEDERHLYLAVTAADRDDDNVLAMAALCVRNRATRPVAPRLRRQWLVAPAGAHLASIARRAPA